MYMRAVRPEPSPAVLFPGLESGVSEASRFSCMKYLGVPGVFDYAGLNRNSRSCSCSYCLPPLQERRRSGLHLFGAQYPPHLFPCLRFAAYLAIGLAQNSGPSGSLILSRKNFAFSASCRFSAAHCNGDFSTVTTDANLRIITRLPLTELWRDDGFSTVERGKSLNLEDIRQLLLKGRFSIID